METAIIVKFDAIIITIALKLRLYTIRIMIFDLYFVCSIGVRYVALSIPILLCSDYEI